MSKSSIPTTSSKQNKTRNIQQQIKIISKATTNLHQSNYYPLVPTITSYFYPKPKLVKKPTPTSLLIKRIKKSSKSIRLKLKKQEKRHSHHISTKVIYLPHQLYFVRLNDKVPIISTQITRKVVIQITTLQLLPHIACHLQVKFQTH